MELSKTPLHVNVYSCTKKTNLLIPWLVDSKSLLGAQSSTIHYDGVDYPSFAHAYYCQRFLYTRAPDVNIEHVDWLCTHAFNRPFTSLRKNLYATEKMIVVDPAWKKKKKRVMLQLLLQFVSVHDWFRRMLLQTHHRPIVFQHDTLHAFWGVRLSPYTPESSSQMTLEKKKNNIYGELLACVRDACIRSHTYMVEMAKALCMPVSHLMRYQFEDAPFDNGAYATIYRAIDRQTGKRVIIKKMRLRKAHVNVMPTDQSQLTQHLKHCYFVEQRRKRTLEQMQHQEEVKIESPVFSHDSIDTVNAENVTDCYFVPQIAREILALRFCQHPSLISTQKCIYDDTRRILYFVMNEYPHTFHSFITQQHARKTIEYDVRTWMYQLLHAIHALHVKKVYHCDLSSTNILVDDQKNLIVCDYSLVQFGTSSIFDCESEPQPEHVAYSMFVLVSMWYRPPELLFSTCHVRASVDMWAIGCLMYEMVTGNILFPTPFDSETDDISTEQHWKTIINTLGNEVTTTLALDHVDAVTIESCPGKMQQIQDEFKAHTSGFDLFKKLMEFDPNKRITAADALKHPFFDGYSPCEKNKRRRLTVY